MDPFFQSILIGLVFGAAALGVHWVFMGDYRRWKRHNKVAQPPSDLPN